MSQIDWKKKTQNILQTLISTQNKQRTVHVSRPQPRTTKFRPYDTVRWTSVNVLLSFLRQLENFVFVSYS